MADAKKCDVCGKLFEHDFPESVGESFVIVRDVKISHYDCYGKISNFDVDMCDECTRRFFDFIKCNTKNKLLSLLSGVEHYININKKENKNERSEN